MGAEVEYDRIVLEACKLRFVLSKKNEYQAVFLYKIPIVTT